MNAGDLHLLHTEFAKMTAAGMGLRQTLRALIDSRPPAAQKHVLGILARELDTGKPFSEGMKAAALPELDVNIISAGERGGRLPQAFDHLAGYYGMLARARRGSLHAMIYPLVMLHLGLLAGNLPMAFMQGRGMAAALLSSLPELGVMYGIALVLWLAWRFIAVTAPENAALDSVVNAIPLLGKTRRSLAMARFTKVWHIALLAGVSFRETIAMAADASRSGMIRAVAGDLQVVLSCGAPLGPAMMAARAFPDAFARSYATAEQSGMLDQDLARWARVFEDEAAAGVKLISAVVPKVIYLLALAYVGWKIVNFWSGYYDGIFKALEDGE